MARDYTQDMAPDGMAPDPNINAYDHDGDGIPNKKDPDYKEMVDRQQEMLKKMYEDGTHPMSNQGGQLQKDSNTINKGVNDVPIFDISNEDVNRFIQSMCFSEKRRMYTPTRYSDRTCDNFEHRKIIDKYNLRLGDSIFYIPPEFINVNESSQTVKEPSIRSTSTLKKKYGYSTTDITIRLVFNGDEQINGFKVESPFTNRPYYVDGLRPFLAQCRVSPIMAVENEFLNGTNGIYSIVIQNIEVRTVVGFPKLLECVIMAMEFDCSTYTMSPSWEYSNLIEWDLYRYNYQRLLGEYVPKSVATKIDSSYKLKEISNFSANKNIKISIPDEEALKYADENELKDKIFDVKNLKYKTILDNNADNFIVTQISFGFENIILSPKLSNASKPTVQYIGGGDGAISLQIITRSESTAMKFKSLIAQSQFIIKKIKDCNGIGFVDMENDFLRLIGSKYLLIDSVTVETVPNFPGTFSINIQASSNDIQSTKVEELNGQRPFWNNRKGTKDDCISQDTAGLINKVTQDTYKEYKLNDVDLYPDLFLPTYTEIDYVIPMINEFKDKNNIKMMDFDRFPRTISTNTIFGKPFAANNKVDPDYYFMYPYLDMSKLEVKASDLVPNNKVENSNVDHIYKNSIESSGKSSGPSSEKILESGPSPTSCKKLGISGARGVDTAFLDALLAKNGCAYVFGAYGQHVYAKNDPRYTKENEDILMAHGGPILDKWRTGVQAFDCSGFVGYGMYALGYFDKIPRQAHTSFKKYCKEVSLSSIRAGDFLTNGDHIAVALGGGKTIEAKGKDYGVCIGEVGNRFSWAGRCNWTKEIINKYKNYKNSSNSADIVTTDDIDKSSDAIGKLGGNLDIYDDIIISKSSKYNVDPNWVKALIITESGMNPVAASSVAFGLMQLTDICCQHLGIPFDKSKLKDPAYNIEYGTKYYSELHSKYKNYKNAAGAYNVGPGAFDRHLKGNYKLPKETINHMERVERNYEKLKGKPAEYSDIDFSGDESVTLTEYVQKKHGNRRQGLAGIFGMPIIIRSPINDLIRESLSINSQSTPIMTDGPLKVVKMAAADYEQTYKTNLALEELLKIEQELIKQEKAVGDKLSTPYTTTINNATKNYHDMVYKSTDRDNEFSLLSSTIDECTYGCRGTMLKAFPTFAFMISTDSSEWFDGKKLWDNFYNYRAVMGITVTHDYEQPSGLAYIKASNLSQNLSRKPKIDYKTIKDDKEYSALNRYFYDDFGFIVGSPKITGSMIESHNTLLKEMKLQSGARIHIRMGYGSLFQNLPVVFNGTVVEVGQGEFLDIVAQSDGTELVNNVVSEKQDKTNGFTMLQKEASNIITSLLIDRYSWTNVLSSKWGEMSEYGIEHFGLFTGKNWAGIANNREYEYDLCKNIYLGTYKQELFCSQKTHDVFDGEEGVEFFLFNRTPWDVMNITAQSLPEFVVYPRYHMFDTRIFFGIPTWLYKYRTDIDSGGIIKEFSKNFSQLHMVNMYDILDNRIKVSSQFLHTNAMCTYVLGNNAENDVKCTTTFFADTSIDWSKQKTKVIDGALQQNYFGPDGLYEWLGFNQGVTNAESVAISSIIDSFNKAYYDEIIILGNATINPYDEIFIDDNYAQMYGLCRVNRVVHSFTCETGFTTSITPGMIAYSKTEDSGSTNNYRNRTNLMDLAASILGGRYMSNDIVENYKSAIHIKPKDSNNEEVKKKIESTRSFLVDSTLNLSPVTNIGKFFYDFDLKADYVHEENREDYILKMSVFGYENNINLRNQLKFLSRVPLLRPVTGFFLYKNSIGIRPLLHKSRPFVSGVRGAKYLIDGFGEITEPEID